MDLLKRLVSHGRRWRTALGRRLLTPSLRVSLLATLAAVVALGSILQPLLPVPSATADDDELKAPHRQDRILVRFKDSARPLAPERHAPAGGRPLKLIGRQGDVVVEIPQGTVKEKLAAYRADPNVLYAAPDYVYRKLDVPNDPRYPSQWALQKVEAGAAWDLGQSSPNVLIAILDTGIDVDHEDLAGKVVQSRNFTDSPTHKDVQGHGTHVAGIAAAVTNNGKGVAGLARAAKLLNVKVLDDDGYGYDSWIADAIYWAADSGAKVINMSLGGGDDNPVMRNAVDYAWNKGVVVVAAAGNESASSPSYPAYYTNVVAVASTTSTDQLSSFSNYGTWVDIAAPGSAILSSVPGNGYASFSGTSMASPYAAGLVALIWGSPYGTSATAVRARLQSSADSIAGTGSRFANGRINARKALEGGGPNPTPSPTPSPTMTPGDCTTTASLRVVLSWRSGDLDAYLWLPSSKGELVYWDERGSLSALPWALLDRDSFFSYWPETISIVRLCSGTYRYGVNNWTGGRVGAARATVSVYRGPTRLASFSSNRRLPGSWWCVFELSGPGGTIRPMNTYGNTACGPHPSGAAGSRTVKERAR